MVVQVNDIIEEYNAIKIRYDKLNKHLLNHDNLIEDKNFILDSPIEVYYDQLNYMKGYMTCLEKRAKLNNIKLN